MNRVAQMTFLLAALLGLTALVYWPGLNGPLILDDVSNLDILRLLSEQGNLSLENILAERGGVLGGRPVSWVSFVLNWHLSAADVWSFKLVNLLIHLLNGVLVLILARCLLEAVEGAEASTRDWLALAVCGFWLLTPLQVSTVLYLVQRDDPAGSLLLGGRPDRILFRAAEACRSTTAPASCSWQLQSPFCWPLATLSKQNGALLVPFLLVIELLVFSPRDGVLWPGRTLVILSGLLLGAGVVRVMLDPQWVLGSYTLRDFSHRGAVADPATGPVRLRTEHPPTTGRLRPGSVP